MGLHVYTITALFDRRVPLRQKSSSQIEEFLLDRRVTLRQKSSSQIEEFLLDRRVPLRQKSSSQIEEFLLDRRVPLRQKSSPQIEEFPLDRRIDRCGGKLGARAIPEFFPDHEDFYVQMIMLMLGTDYIGRKKTREQPSHPLYLYRYIIYVGVSANETVLSSKFFHML